MSCNTVYLICLHHVSLWMAVNRLQLNHEKTEVLWCSSARCQHQIPTTPVRVGCTSVTAAMNLGIYLDGDVSMRTARDYNCSGVLCHATSDTNRSPSSATSSHADHASVACHQQTGLLQLCDGRCT